MFPANLIRGPYLLDVEDDAILVQWETDIGTPPNAVDMRHIDDPAYTRYDASTSVIYDWAGVPHYVHTARISGSHNGREHVYRLVGYQYLSPLYEYDPPSSASTVRLVLFGDLLGRTSRLTSLLSVAGTVQYVVSTGSMFAAYAADEYAEWARLSDVLGTAIRSKPLVRLSPVDDFKRSIASQLHYSAADRVITAGAARVLVCNSGGMSAVVSSEIESTAWLTAKFRVLILPTAHASLYGPVSTRRIADVTGTRDFIRKVRPSLVVAGGARSYQRGVIDATDGTVVTPVTYITIGTASDVVDRSPAQHDATRTGVQFVANRLAPTFTKLTVGSAALVLSTYDLDASAEADAVTIYAEPLR